MSKVIIPTEAELRAEFHKRCEELLLDDKCEECRYHSRNCFSAYIYDVLTFRCDQRDSFLLLGDDDEDLRQQDWDEWCEQLKPAPNGENCQTLQKSPLETLPAWCRVGQWVMTEEGDIGEITGVNGKYLHILEPGDEDWCGIIYSACKPIRFREYSYDEAKGLLGKLMESSYGGYPEAEIVTRVSKTTPVGAIAINGTHFDWLTNEYKATIDGLPIGVPVVDEEAMKEVK